MFALSFGIEDSLGLGINPGVILVLFLLAIISQKFKFRV